MQQRRSLQERFQRFIFRDKYLSSQIYLSPEDRFLQSFTHDADRIVSLLHWEEQMLTQDVNG